MEEILINSNFTTGTTMYLFNTVLNNQNLILEATPSYLLFDDNNQPNGLYYFDNKIIFSRTPENNFIVLSSATNNYITGYTNVISFNNVLLNSEKLRYEKRFKKSALEETSGSSRTFVFFEDKLNEDLYLNVGLHSTYDFLNTLSIYNNLVGSMPKQEAQTGVVFGKLEAIQKIIDPDTGVNIKIPLRNVPIGIFNSSEDFQSPTSVDENGNRIMLNLEPIIKKQNYSFTEYFNQQSMDFDEKFLEDSSSYTSIPDQYKYITKTNENGEFILYDVPIGTQVAIFEVDLLKQGLTKEEVGLNFFPYPTFESPNIDQVPHFFFRQFPIDVVPAWGDIQTGYTELNISVNLDLRKWSTYFIPPISFSNKNITQLQTEDQLDTSLKIFVRDMTKSNFSFDISNLSNDIPIDNTEIVEIANLLNRDTSQEYEWRNEFTQQKITAEFRTDDYNAFKVPANIYSKNYINSENINKPSPFNVLGTWFCAYQFKMQYLDNGVFRTTGFELQYLPNNQGYTTKDHYHVNKFNGGYDSNLTNKQTTGSGISLKKEPYLKPWSATYPEPIKIPKIPKSLNPNFRTIDDPRYTDGDLVGMKYASAQAGGLGLQENNNGGKFANKFSKRVNASYLYKYEAEVSWHEKYANEYPVILKRLQGDYTTEVENGERYQRVEAGFGYFLKPFGWPKVDYNNSYDQINKNMLSIGVKQVSIDSTFNIRLNVDGTAPYKEGGIDIYRIVDPLDLLPPEPPIVPTFANFITKNIYRKRDSNKDLSMVRPTGNNKGTRDSVCYPIGHEGNNNYYFRNFNFKIFNRGLIKVIIQGVDVLPGNAYDFGTINFLPETIQLPGNDGFDVTSFSYKNCNYLFEFSQYEDGTGPTTNFVNETTTVPTIDYNSNLCLATEKGVNHFMINEYRVLTQVIKIKKNGSCGNSLVGGNAKFNGVILGGGGNLGKLPSSLPYSIFVQDGQLPTTCDSSLFVIDLIGNVRNLPYQIV